MGLLASSKPTSKDAVKKAAEHFMQTNGQVSSLEIKNYLRNDGYFATQNRVSSILQELQRENNWAYSIKSDNGVSYNVYKPAPASNRFPNSLGDVVKKIVENNSQNDVNSDDDTLDELDTDLMGLHSDLEQEFKCSIYFSDVPSVKNGSAVSEITIFELISLVEVSLAPKTTASQTQRTGRVKIQIKPKAFVKDGKEAKSACSSTDWFVTLKGDVKPYIFDSSCTSDHVRTVYARMEGVKIQDVRARRVKNIR